MIYACVLANKFSKATKAFKSLYDTSESPPENFIMQMAFTKYASFLLTTDGRVFSWGEQRAELGQGNRERQKNKTQ